MEGKGSQRKRREGKEKIRYNAGYGNDEMITLTVDTSALAVDYRRVA